MLVTNNLIKNLFFKPLNSLCVQKNSLIIIEALVIISLLINYLYLVYVVLFVVFRYLVLNSKLINYILFKAKLTLVLKLSTIPVDNFVNSTTFLPLYYLRSYNI